LRIAQRTHTGYKVCLHGKMPKKRAFHSAQAPAHGADGHLNAPK
jgi:hypothetical protein